MRNKDLPQHKPAWTTYTASEQAATNRPRQERRLPRLSLRAAQIADIVFLAGDLEIIADLCLSLSFVALELFQRTVFHGVRFIAVTASDDWYDERVAYRLPCFLLFYFH